jgi:predicted anti-sigma-YlaC factor YlaD
MRCSEWRDAVSAMIDGEDPGIETALVDAHLDHCADCAAFRTFATGLRRARLHEATPMADLSPRVVKAARVADRRSAWGLARLLLAVCAAAIIAWSIPDLLGHGQGGETHAARHLGAFTVAFGAALLVVVARPARARSMLPVAMVLGFTLIITATIDLIGGHAPLIGEATHIPELASVVLLWLLGSPARRLPLRGQSRRPIAGDPPNLRSVDPLQDAG